MYRVSSLLNAGARNLVVVAAMDISDERKSETNNILSPLLNSGQLTPTLEFGTLSTSLSSSIYSTRNITHAISNILDLLWHILSNFSGLLQFDFEFDFGFLWIQFLGKLELEEHRPVYHENILPYRYRFHWGFLGIPSSIGIGMSLHLFIYVYPCVCIFDGGTFSHYSPS